MHHSCVLALALCGLPDTRSKPQENYDFGQLSTQSTTTKVFYAPDPGLDPYWVGGEWVFASTTNTPPESTLSEVVPVDANSRILVCGRVCPWTYKKQQGKVCVHRLDNAYDPHYTAFDENYQKVQGLIDWRLGGLLDRNHDYLRTFPSLCHFLDAQCREQVAHGSAYAFLHMGECLQDADAFPNLMGGKFVVDRKRKHVQRYNDDVDTPGKLPTELRFVIIIILGSKDIFSKKRILTN
ncbi:uncharacterized protein LOC125232971 [Leguminivora glycinivorella]|uniref:uncharacterized protein LOC125232971 n=1 Tax=Leguminivora glycinivorella TaxID=1035111 RepID=UPI00200CA1ED|nr:uncharacterized protein LOC125232971 [Leguminivora glycinivorella]XP_047994787.1 uncharacterized protein LOC125232971 [Leguminivora glycinivorella]